jgi:hypothetical protein
MRHDEWAVSGSDGTGQVSRIDGGAEKARRECLSALGTSVLSVTSIMRSHVAKKKKTTETFISSATSSLPV